MHEKQIFDLCSDCPLKAGQFEKFSIEKGEGTVFIDRNDVITYAYVATDGKSLGHGMVDLQADAARDIELPEQFDNLARSITGCDGPAEQRTRRAGLLGKLGFSTVTKVCPAVTEHFDPDNAESVRTYFQQTRGSE